MQPGQRKEYKNILESEAIGRLLFKLSGPVFMGMFVQSLYNVISTVFLGRYVGALSIAGLAIAFPLQMLGMAFGSLSGVGGSSLISRLLGARQYERAEKALGNGILLGLLLSGTVGVVLLPFMDFWLRLIGASKDVLPYAHDYMIFVGVGIMLQIVSVTLLNSARGEGNTRVGMVAQMSGALLSIIFSYIFIVWLHMGIKGAGLAVLSAQIVAAGYLGLYYLNGNSYLKLRRINLKPDFHIMKEILAIGVGAFGQMFAGSLSTMIINTMVVRYGGDYAVGAFGVVQRIIMFTNLPTMVISQSSQPIIGFNYGARRFGHLLKAFNMAVVLSFVIGVGGFLIVYFIPEDLMRIFSSDPRLISLGSDAARRMLIALPIIGAMNIGTMTFQAIGQARRAFIAALSRPVFILCPTIFLLGRFFGLNGIWYTFPVSDVFTVSLITILFLPILRHFRSQARSPGQVALASQSQ